MPCILIIDDDPQILQMMQKVLLRVGYDVLSASDGRQGMNLCNTNHVDLVITDIVMPEMEGLEVIMGIKRILPNVKIMAVSGGARIQADDYLDLASALGAHRTLAKPFMREELLQAVRELLE